VCAQPAFSDLSGQIATSQIPDTAVTPGSYTSTNITVNAQGRITAASNGGGLTGTTSAANFPFVGTVTASQIGPTNCPFTFNFPANFATPNSLASCGTNPSETDVYTVKVAGSSIG